MSLPYRTLTLTLPKKSKVKKISQYLMTMFLTLSVIMWSIGVPISIFLPRGGAEAAAPTISSVGWKGGSTTVLVNFSKSVFKDDWKATAGSFGPSWGPMGGLEISDFTLNAATSSATIISIKHEGGSTKAILTLSVAPVSGERIACATNAVWSEGYDNSNTPEACGTTAVLFQPANEDTTGPTSTATVNLFSKTSFSVKFSEAVNYPTSATSSYWAERIRLNTADTTDPYDGTVSVYTQDVSGGNPQDSWGWRDNWGLSEVWFDIWDAKIDQNLGANSLTLLATGSNVITDIFGNALNGGTNVTVSPLEFSTGFHAMGFEAKGAFRRSATVVDLVFSDGADEITAENTAFYTLTTAATDTETISSAVSCHTAGECPASGGVPAITSNKVVRITASSASIKSYDFTTTSTAWTSFPDTLRVNGQWDSAGAPKSIDGAFNTADWPIPIEDVGSAEVDGIGVDGSTIKVMIGEIVDPGSVATSSFTFKRGGNATGTISSAKTNFDNREIFVKISGNPLPIQNGDVLEISTTTASGIKDAFGITLAASAAGSPCATGTANVISCTIDGTSPKITRVTYTDVDSSNSFNKNDTLVVTFSEDMNTFTASSIWDWDIIYGANCNATTSASPRTNCSWGWWGDGAAVNWSGDDDSSDPDSSGNAADDDLKITLGNFPTVGEGYIITTWWDPYGHAGVQDKAGNAIGNVGIISSQAGAVSSVKHIDANSSASLNAGDKVEITFSKRMVTTNVTATNASTTLAVSGKTNIYGSSPTVVWDSTEKIVTITLGAGFTIADADVIDPTTSVIDMNGNAVTGTVTFRISVSGGGGLGLTVNSKARFKMLLEFQEPIANQNYMSYPAESRWSSTPLGSTYKSGSPVLAATDFSYTDASSGGQSISRINYVSRDGKKVILQMASTTDAIVSADTIAASTLIGGTTFGIFSGVSTSSINYADATGPTIKSVSVAAGGGGFGFTGGSSESIGPGKMVRVEFSEPIDPGSFFDYSSSPPSITAAKVNAALPLSNSHSWGSVSDIWFWSSSTTDFGSLPDVAEITLGSGATLADADTVSPTGVTDVVGNVGTGSATFDASFPRILNVISDITLGASSTIFDANDTVKIVFNKEMDTAMSTTTIGSVINKSFYVDTCTFGGSCGQGSWGTTSTVSVARSTTTKTNDSYIITLGSSSNLANGNRVWADPMYIITSGGKSVWDPGIIDISAPVLQRVDVEDADSNAELTTNDSVYYTFSEPMDDNTINTASSTHANYIGTVLPFSAGNYNGATTTANWVGTNVLKFTFNKNSDDGASGTVNVNGTITINPTTAVKDEGGNIDATTGSGPAMSAFTISPPIGVTFLDADTSNPGIDKRDIKVTWTAPSVGIVNLTHYNVYILPALMSVNPQTGTNQYLSDSSSATHRSLNSSGITATTSFTGTSSSYAVYDDSRFEYVTEGVPPGGTEFFPLMEWQQYRAHVVACTNSTCSNRSLAGSSAPFNFGTENFTQGGGPFTGGTGTMGGAFAFGGGTPWVEGTIPFSGQTSVPTNTQVIGAKFSEPLDQTTMTSANFIVEKVSDSSAVSGTLAYMSDKNAVTFKPAADLTASTQYQIRVTTGVKSTFGVAMNGQYVSTFTTGTGKDTTAPSVLDNKFQAEAMDTSAVSPLIPEISVRFTDDLNPTSVTSNSVKLYQATTCSGTAVTGSVDYDPWGRILHFWLDSGLTASQAHCLRLTGSLIKDVAGNALGSDYDVKFTTRALTGGESAAPQISWADADNFHVSIGFNAPMKESTVTNSQNWTFESPTGTVISLSSAEFFYDNFSNMLHIDGLGLMDGNSFKITASQSIKGLNGTAIDASFNNKTGTVHGMTGPGIKTCGSTFEFGCGMDNGFNTNVMMFMPTNVWPEDRTADVVTSYFIDMPLNQAIDNNGKVVFEFPAGFDVSSAGAAPTNQSFVNNDLNGPAPGTVTIASVTPSPMSNKIEVKLSVAGGQTSTGSKDFLTFDIEGIKNTATPASMDFTKFSTSGGMGGYQVTISTKDSTGKILESNLKSMPFPIEAGGNGRITLKIKEEDGSTNITGTARVFLDSSQGGHREGTVTAVDNGTFVFRNLQTSVGGTNYSVWIEPPKGLGYLSIGDLPILLTDATSSATHTIKLQKGTSSLNLTINHSTGLANQVLLISGWGDTGWTDATTTLESDGSTAATLKVKDGTWTVSLNPYFGDMMSMFGPMPSMPFMPPPPQSITIKTSATATFNLTSISSSDKITGFVYDENGTGMPDADVWAHDPLGAFGAGDFTRTDPTGAYTLRLPAGTYKIGAGKMGLGEAPEKLVTSPTSGVTFTLIKGVGSAKGYVLDSSGAQLNGAIINAKNASTGEVREAKSDSKNGSYSFFLPAGTWTLTAWHPTYGKVKTSEGTPASSYSISISQGSELSGKNFKVSGTYYTISGYICEVVGTSGCSSGPMGGAVVWAEEITTATGALTGNGSSESTGPNGYYTLTLPASTSGTTHYNLYAKIPQGGKLPPYEGSPSGTGARPGINLSAAKATRDWATKTPIPVDVLINNVQSSSNNSSGKVSEFYLNVYDPSTNYETSAYKKNATSTTIELLQTPSNSSGYVVKLAIPGFGELSPDSAVLNSSSKFTVGSSAAGTNNLVFTLPSTSITIAGTVNSGANTWVYAYSESSGEEHGVVTDSGGAFSLELAAGTYNLKADKKGYLGYKHASTISTDTTGLSLSLGSLNSSITGTVFESGGSTLVTEGYVYAVEKGGTGNSGADIANGSFTIQVNSGTTWDIFASSKTGYEGSKLGVSAGSSVTLTLSTAITGYTSILEEPTSVSPSKGKVINDSGNTNTTVEFTANSMQGSGAGTEKNVSVDNEPGTHESAEHKVIGSEKSVEIDKGSISDLQKPTEFSIKMTKSEVDSLITNDADITAANVDDMFNSTNLGHFEETIGNDGEWVSEPTISRAMIKNGSASTSFTYEDFSTFATNVGANQNYYYDYEVTYKTMVTKMSIRGTTNPGLSDTTAPYVNNGNTIAAPTASVTSNSITLDWTALTETCNSGQTCLEPSGESGVLEYNVYRSVSAFSSYTVSATTDPATVSGITQVNGSQIAAGTKTFTDSSVNAGTTYYYEITVVDTKGNGDQWQYLSGQRQATTLSSGSAPAGGGGGGAKAAATPTPTATTTAQTATTTVAEPKAGDALNQPSVSSRPEGTLIRGVDDPRVYVIKNGKALWVPSAAAFNASGFKWEDIKVVPASEVAATASAQLIQVEGEPEVYLIIGSKKRHIPTAEAFVGGGYKWEDIIKIKKEHAQGFKTANLIRVAGGIKVYIVEKGVKRHIPNPESFNSYKYDWNDVVEVPQIVIDGYGIASMMRAMDDYKVYLLEGNSRKWVKTAEIFESYGYDWNTVLDVSRVELESYTKGAEITKKRSSLLHKVFDVGERVMSIF